MIVNELDYSEFENRMDAEYYRPIFFKVEKSLEKLEESGVPVKSLEEISDKITTSAFYSSISQKYSKSGIPFLRVSDIQNFSIDTSDLVYLPPNVLEDSNSIRTVHPGDIVISKGGSLANVALIPEELGKCAICRDIIGVPFETGEKLQPEYVVAFLNSKYGKVQILREKSQQVQAHLTLDAVKEVKIPKLSESFQDTIKDTIRNAFKKRKKGAEKLEGVERNLLNTLNIEIKSEERKIYNTNYEEFSRKRRLDAEFHKPKYTRLTKSIERSPHKFYPITEFCQKIKKGYEPGSNKYLEKGIPFLRVRNIEKFKINRENLVFLSEREYEKNKNENSPNAGDVLFTKDGRIGSSSVVTENWEKSLLCGGIVIFTPNDRIDPHFLSLYLNSKIIELMGERKTIGSTIPHFGYRRSKKIKVPDISFDLQKEISETVQKHMKLRRESKSHIENAKQKVEEELGKNITLPTFEHPF